MECWCFPYTYACYMTLFFWLKGFVKVVSDYIRFQVNGGFISENAGELLLLQKLCQISILNRGHRELLDGRQCRSDSEQWPWTSNLCTVHSWFSDIKFSDNLWFSDYFTKTIFQFTKSFCDIMQFNGSFCEDQKCH